jgi:hypothetical protein
MGDIGIADAGFRFSEFGLFFDIGTKLVPGSEPDRPSEIQIGDSQLRICDCSLT